MLNRRSRFADGFASAPSPDGKQIAYVWGTGTIGRAPRDQQQGWSAKSDLLRGPESGDPALHEIELYGWSMDGKQILFALLSAGLQRDAGRPRL